MRKVTIDGRIILKPPVQLGPGKRSVVRPNRWARTGKTYDGPGFVPGSARRAAKRGKK